jgi:hypothetical protein
MRPSSPLPHIRSVYNVIRISMPRAAYKRHLLGKYVLLPSAVLHLPVIFIWTIYKRRWVCSGPTKVAIKSGFLKCYSLAVIIVVINAREFAFSSTASQTSVKDGSMQYGYRTLNLLKCKCILHSVVRYCRYQIVKVSIGYRSREICCEVGDK